MSTESQVLSDTRYSFRTRFAKGIGTNPDELIAASLGGCFSMALANELGLAGFDAERIETTDRKSTRLNSSHVSISYAVFCLKKKNKIHKLSNKRRACSELHLR